MHSRQFIGSGGLDFYWDGKLDGFVDICRGDCLANNEFLDVPVQDLMEFVADVVRQQDIETLNDMTWQEILGVEE